MYRGMIGCSTGILKVVEYHEQFPDLVGLLLEDSWILEVAPSPRGLSLRLEIVLTPDHPHYEPPLAGEQHCYRNAWLIVRSAEPLDIQLSGTPPAVDATGQPDLGNVDRFIFNQAARVWELQGDWGHPRVRDPKVSLRFD
jgi:hypothetical protein